MPFDCPDRAPRPDGTSRRLLRGLVTAAALLCTVPAVAQTLSIGVARSPLSLPIYVAEAEGLFREEGLDVRTTECVGGQRCIGLVFDGRTDVATVGDVPVMLASFKRSDFVVIATMATTSEDLKLIATRVSGVSAATQLGGRRIGLVVGTAGQYFLDTLLLMHGVEPREVTLVPLQGEGLQAALESGQVDAVAAWEPFGYRIVRAMKQQAVVLPQAGNYTATMNLVAQRALAGPRDADLARLLAALQRAERFILRHPDRARAILARRLDADDDFVRWVWPQQVFRLSLDQALLRTLESEARWAIREGHAAGRTAPGFLAFLHRRPLSMVNPAAVGISR